MKMKIMFVVALALLIPFVLAYSVQMNIDADVVFDTDVYACSDSACDGLSFETSGNSYSLIGSGDDYFIEFDYAECFRPHMYEVHVWGDEVSTNDYFIDLIKRDDCVGTILSGGISDGVIELGESVDVYALIHSAYDLPAGVPSTTVIPGVLEDEYSSLIKVEFFADGVKIGEDQDSVLMGEDGDFEIDWTPSAVGTYDVTVVSSVFDCACSDPNPQTTYIGTLNVNAVPVCVEDIVFGNWVGWIDDSACVGGWKTQTRARWEYDANNCGTFGSVLHSEYQDVVCEMPCVEDVVFGDWSSWVNDSVCVGNWMNQSRTRTEYDANSCGVFDDVLHSEDRSVVCEMPCSVDVVFGDWSSWVNSSGCVGGLMNQSRARTEYDNNSCGVFDDVVHEEARVVNCSLPVCSLDSDCSDDYYGDRYCDGDDVYKTLYDFSCVNGSCVEDASEEFVKECDEECDDGKCVGDDDDDNTWNRLTVSYVPSRIAPLAVIDLGGKTEERSWMWLWILLLIVGILILVWMIVRVMRA